MGAWQKLERGEISLAGTFFDEFAAELSSRPHWKAYCDKLRAQGEKGEYALKLLKEKYGVQTDGITPNVPPIDAKVMFWNMMRMSRQPDPWVFPALLKLKASGRFVIAALSNTIDFPVDIKDETGKLFKSQAVSDSGETVGDIRSFFDAFVSSAHTGMRKPDRKIYELALQECQRVAQEKGLSNHVQMGDILFLDDIGGNLKTAKQLGMRTIKVNLGRTKEAVKELEQAVGMSLIDENAGSSRL
jgi:hypothetical protein